MSNNPLEPFVYGIVRNIRRVRDTVIVVWFASVLVILCVNSVNHPHEPTPVWFVYYAGIPILLIFVWLFVSAIRMIWKDDLYD